MPRKVGRCVRHRCGQGVRHTALAILLFFLSGPVAGIVNAAEPPASVVDQSLPEERSKELLSPKPGIWEDEVGNGFRPGTDSFSFGMGASYGVATFGSHEAHDLALLSLEYGHMLGHVVGGDHWYRGNFEFRAELFSGAEFSPNTEWVVGLTPHLRYNFATGTRWVPFVDLGAGVTATSIGPPDLSNYFEFNLQAEVGVHRFLRDNLAVTLEARYMHMSCAGLTSPNAGLNTVMGLVGLSWFF